MKWVLVRLLINLNYLSNLGPTYVRHIVSKVVAKIKDRTRGDSANSPCILFLLCRVTALFPSYENVEKKYFYSVYLSAKGKGTDELLTL